MLRARPVEEEAEPGRLADGGGRLLFGCAAGALELLEVHGPKTTDATLIGLGDDPAPEVRAASTYYLGLRRTDASRKELARRLKEAGYGEVTTEVGPAPTFFYAEDYHQQYLAKNPGGYCGLGGTGVSCPVGVLAKA